MDDTFKNFVRECFRELKVKGAARMKMGRRTYDWLAKQEKKDRLDHLTAEKLADVAERYALKKVVFDDGNTYIVKPEMEREILVEFFNRKETLEPRLLRARIKGDVPAADEDFTERCFISHEAVRLLTDDADTPEMETGDAVDFLTNLQIEIALDTGRLRLAYEEGSILVLTADEEPGDSVAFPLLLKTPIAGTEVSMETLDIRQRTAVIGEYRDTVGEASHDFEHLVTKTED